MTWLQLINAVLPVLVAAAIYGLIRLAMSVTRIEDKCRTLDRDLKRLEEQMRETVSSQAANFRTTCSERHHNLGNDIKEMKGWQTQIIKRLERLRANVARLGDVLNGKRIATISEDTES